ncbi:hypothetical protein EV174_003345 [Coemansia sp. RSA 2320]|nr:hypothetical protein EV174_003345 [Coemansia sp. RSA 2320]
MAAETSMAASEEPKHLGRLPASSSWCRVVWESIVELSESLADGGGGAVVQSVECKLVYLLTSMLRAARPFPVVDSRKVFERVLGVYMGLADATNIMTRRLPLLAVLLSTADRLSPLSFSMAQFVTDAIQQVVGKAVDISSKLATEHQFIHGADCDTFAAIALGRLGSMGLGRVLRLAGFSHDSGSAAEVAETKGALKTLHATWESSLPIPDRVLQQSATRILGSTAFNHGDGLPGAEALVVDANGALDVWLKGTFKEWARRHHCSGRQAQDGAQNDVLVSIACSMQKVASAVHGSHRIRHGSTEAQRRIIQGLDLVILAASVAGAKSAAPAASADDFIKVGVPARQYSVQLRTRVLGLLDLARSEPLRRALRLVLAHLALLGMLPPSDLQRVV